MHQDWDESDWDQSEEHHHPPGGVFQHLLFSGTARKVEGVNVQEKLLDHWVWKEAANQMRQSLQALGQIIVRPRCALKEAAVLGPHGLHGFKKINSTDIEAEKAQLGVAAQTRENMVLFLLKPLVFYRNRWASAVAFVFQFLQVVQT